MNQTQRNTRFVQWSSLLVAVWMLGTVFAAFWMPGADVAVLHAEAPGAVLVIAPPTTTVTVGAVFSVTVRVHTAQVVNAAAAYVNFDPAQLQVSQLVTGTAFSTVLQSEFDNTRGHVNFAAGALGQSLPNTDFTLLTIVFKAGGATEGTPLTFSSLDPRRSDVTSGGSSVLDYAEAGAVVVRSPATPTHTPTVTPVTPMPTPTLVTPMPTPTLVTPMPTPTLVTPMPTPAPGTLRILRVEPSQGVNNLANEVTIYGTGLRADTQLSLSGIALSSIALTDYALTDAQGTQATALVPANLPAGVYTVIATNPDGATATLAEGYTAIDASRVDLSVSDSHLWFDPLPVRQAAETELGITVLRSGGTAPLTGVRVAFYQDEIVPANLLGTQDVPPMADGNGVVEAVQISWTPTESGTHVIYGVVDPDNVIQEGSEGNNVARWTLEIQPPTTAEDTIPPAIAAFTVNNGAQSPTQPEVTLTSAASDEGSGVASMYIIERVYNNAARYWVAMQQTGWIDYSPTYAMTLSASGGLHYFQIWVADGAGNISRSSANTSLNYIRPEDTVRAGQIRIYRLALAAGDRLIANVTPTRGDPDLFVWGENGALLDYSMEFDLEPETINLEITQAGIYQIEVYGYLDSAYAMDLAPSQQQAVQTADAVASLRAADSPNSKSVPTTPSVALNSAPPGQQAIPAAPTTTPASGSLYLPLVRR